MKARRRRELGGIGGSLCQGLRLSGEQDDYAGRIRMRLEARLRGRGLRGDWGEGEDSGFRRQGCFWRQARGARVCGELLHDSPCNRSMRSSPMCSIAFLFRRHRICRGRVPINPPSDPAYRSGAPNACMTHGSLKQQRLPASTRQRTSICCDTATTARLELGQCADARMQGAG